MDMKFKGVVFAGSGLLDVLNPDPAAIHISDIGHGLAAKVRFGGHTRRDLPFLSVAWHSLFCEMIADQMGLPIWVRLQALLHDAPEYVLGDSVTPVKVCLTDYRPIERGLWAVIAAKYGAPVEFAPEVHQIDRFALDCERDAIGIPGDWTPAPVVPDEWRAVVDKWFAFWRDNALKPRLDAHLFIARAKALIDARRDELGVC